MSACEECLKRRWLLERLAPYLEPVRRRIDDLLELDAEALISAVGGKDVDRLQAELERFDVGTARAMRGRAGATGLALVCRDDDDYPARLRELIAPPAVLSVNGHVARLAELCSSETVAIVGTRRPSPYGNEVAETMARGLSAAGVAVISGMAYGIDAMAHEGALLGGGRTVAVLAGSAGTATPAGKAGLFKRIVATGAVISEHGPGAGVWRWALQARNRLIAGLATMTVLVEGPERSGALITVRYADRLERPIGVVPGQVGVPPAAGPNLLLAKGRAGRHSVNRGRVSAVRDAQDVLDLLYGEGIVEISQTQMREPPTPIEAAVLAKIAAGASSMAMLDAADIATLAGLEIKGWVRRGTGGGLTLGVG